MSEQDETATATPRPYLTDAEIEHLNGIDSDMTADSIAIIYAGIDNQTNRDRWIAWLKALAIAVDM